MADQSYLSYMNYSQYGATSSGSGSITLKSRNSSHSFDLDEEAIHDMRVLADNLVKRRRCALAQEISKLDVLPAISFEDKSKAIDVEVDPF